MFWILIFMSFWVLKLKVIYHLNQSFYFVGGLEQQLRESVWAHKFWRTVQNDLSQSAVNCVCEKESVTPYKSVCNPEHLRLTVFIISLKTWGELTDSLSVLWLLIGRLPPQLPLAAHSLFSLYLHFHLLFCSCSLLLDLPGPELVKFAGP